MTTINFTLLCILMILSIISAERIFKKKRPFETNKKSKSNAILSSKAQEDKIEAHVDFDMANIMANIGFLYHAWAIQPENVTNAGELIKNLCAAKRTEEAVSFATEWLAAGYAPNANFLNQQGLAFKSLLQYENATKCFRNALALEPDNEIITHNMITTLYEIKHPKLDGEKGRAYPIKKTVILKEEETALLEFKITAHFGSHDVRNSGEIIVSILTREGDTLNFTTKKDEWLSIAQGIESYYSVSYDETSQPPSRESVYGISIKPDVCPIELTIKQEDSYSSSQYPRNSKSSLNYYVIIVVNENDIL